MQYLQLDLSIGQSVFQSIPLQLCMLHRHGQRRRRRSDRFQDVLLDRNAFSRYDELAKSLRDWLFKGKRARSRPGLFRGISRLSGKATWSVECRVNLSQAIRRRPKRHPKGNCLYKRPGIFIRMTMTHKDQSSLARWYPLAYVPSSRTHTRAPP